MKIFIKELFIEEAIEILSLIKESYNWKKHKHPIVMKKGTIGLTDICHGKKGDWHQVIKNVKIEIKQAIPKSKLAKLKKILTKYKIEFKEIK